MGTDIHTVFQAKVNGIWQDIASGYEENRHYSLFAWLGNVRNGFGFAGIQTHNPITPLSSNRGFPEDFLIQDEHHLISDKSLLPSWWREGDEESVWMGYHDHSWLSLDEILSASPPTIMRTGVISLEEFHSWDKQSPLESWCGDISGPRIQVNDPSSISPTTTHVRVSWLSNLLLEFSYFIELCQSLKEKHGEVRTVFGFDS